VDHDLAADHLTIVLDNRGVGRSAGPAGTYTVAHMAADVVAVMGHAGLDSAHVLGTSLGGMIAQELVLRYPRRVRSLVLAATAAGSAHGTPITPRGMATLAAAALVPAPLRTHLTALATLAPAHRHKRLATPPTAMVKRRATSASLTGMIGQAFAIFGHRAADRLAQIAVPTLVIHGECDALIDPSHARSLADLIPTARLESWPDTGHDLATEDPRRLADSVRRHVQTVRAVT
jgi:pimeloyl-ACP methyl ester carboxylesterase